MFYTILSLRICSEQFFREANKGKQVESDPLSHRTAEDSINYTTRL